MSDGQDENGIVNPIDDWIVPTMGRMLTLEFEPQRSPDPVRLVRQRAVDELDRTPQPRLPQDRLSMATSFWWPLLDSA